jgi:hypothetical protein
VNEQKIWPISWYKSDRCYRKERERIHVCLSMCLLQPWKRCPWVTAQRTETQGSSVRRHRRRLRLRLLGPERAPPRAVGRIWRNGEGCRGGWRRAERLDCTCIFVLYSMRFERLDCIWVHWRMYEGRNGDKVDSSLSRHGNALKALLNSCYYHSATVRSQWEKTTDWEDVGLDDWMDGLSGIFLCV